MLFQGELALIWLQNSCFRLDEWQLIFNAENVFQLTKKKITLTKGWICVCIAIENNRFVGS